MKNEKKTPIVRNVTPDLTEKEKKERATYIVENLMNIRRNKKDKTA